MGGVTPLAGSAVGGAGAVGTTGSVGTDGSGSAKMQSLGDGEGADQVRGEREDLLCVYSLLLFMPKANFCGLGGGRAAEERGFG